MSVVFTADGEIDDEQLAWLGDLGLQSDAVSSVGTDLPALCPVMVPGQRHCGSGG